MIVLVMSFMIFLVVFSFAVVISKIDEFDMPRHDDYGSQDNPVKLMLDKDNNIIPKGD